MSYTLLQLVNRVLLDVGERQVTSIASSTSLKAKAYIQDAFNDIQMFHNWEWLNVSSGVSAFTNEATTAENLRRIRTVFWNNGTTFVSIPWIPYEDFVSRELVAMDNTLPPAEVIPEVYTILDDTTILFNPYPTTENQRNAIKIDGIKYITSPENDLDIITLPDRYVNTLIKRAVYMMLIRHLGELDSAQSMNFEFETVMQRFRDQENRTPMKGTSMYQGGRQRNGR